MKTVSDLLREADPLANEPRRSAADRQIARQRILATPRGVQQQPTRRMALAAAAVVMIGLVTGARFWPRAAGDVVAAVRFEVRLAEATPTLGLRPVQIAHTNRTIYLHDAPVVTNSDIASARVVPGDNGTFNVALQFNADGAAKMLRATENHNGRPMAILIDGEVVMAPTVRARISTAATIDGQFTKAEVDRIVNGIIGR
jgi:preprotein translocase subunit SecD